MVLIRFYGVLATTASIFVGILTAYLITRLSDLKAGRSRIRRQADAINTELESLKTNREERVRTLVETQNRWERETAEDQVDSFISFNVGREWNPSPDAIDPADALDALVQYRDLSEDEVIQHHYDVLVSRWDEIAEKLQPRPFGQVDPGKLIDTSEMDAANAVRGTLWDIYDREQYDLHDTQVADSTRQIETLEDQRENLHNEYDSLDPQDLQDSIKAMIVPIFLSVILPVLIRFLHEIGFVVSELTSVAFLEPWIVLIAWLLGFFWTLIFIWNRVQNVNEDFPDPPSKQGGASEE
jgi:hypothetical protein